MATTPPSVAVGVSKLTCALVLCGHAGGSCDVADLCRVRADDAGAARAVSLRGRTGSNASTILSLRGHKRLGSRFTFPGRPLGKHLRIDYNIYLSSHTKKKHDCTCDPSGKSSSTGGGSAFGTHGACCRPPAPFKAHHPATLHQPAAPQATQLKKSCGASLEGVEARAESMRTLDPPDVKGWRYWRRAAPARATAYRIAAAVAHTRV